jgi:cell division protein ZapA (FtsZ GTPase activity inhibitor)
MPEKRSIPVRILGQEYRVRSEADEAVVRQAAGVVDETMQRIRQRTGTVDTLDLAVLAALNLANQLASGSSPAVEGEAPRPQAPPGPDPERLRRLIEQVEAAAGGPAPA